MSPMWACVRQRPASRVLSARGSGRAVASAGRLYRLRLAIAPGDVIAQRGRDEVVRLARIGSPLFSKEPAEVQRAVRWQHVALGMFILLCITVAVVLFRQVAQRLP